VEKGCRKVNMVQILCTHACKRKKDNCWNYSRNGAEKGIRENGEGGKFNYYAFDILQEPL
jgi:hypothetical protein